jgi:hypothetical protein
MSFGDYAVNWRLQVVERNVSRGLEDPRDLESVKARGFVSRPDGDLCRSMAIAYAAEVDKPSQPKRVKNNLPESS